MEKLIQGLRHFRQSGLWERKELFERSTRGQRPHALLITCSDSRVRPDTLMPADPGDLFVSRNAAVMHGVGLSVVKLVHTFPCSASGSTGGERVLDWGTLRARFHTARPRPRTT